MMNLFFSNQQNNDPKSKGHNWRHMAQNVALGGSLTLLLSACATTGPAAPIRQAPVAQAPVDVPITPIEPVAETPSEAVKTPETEVTDTVDKKDATNKEVVKPVFLPRGGLTPPHMQGRDISRIALILPFSASNSRLREEAGSMLYAAEMAVFDRPDPDTLLIALDSAGTAQGASQAVTSAVNSGADIILGPLLSGNSTEAARAARKSGTPVLSFSSDQNIAGNGLYLLSFPPEAEVARVTDYAAENGALKFAYLGPDSAYGRRVSAAYKQAIDAVGGELSLTETYVGRDINVMQGPARNIATAYGRAYENDKTAFDAIILPEGGTSLRSLAPLLTYYEGRTANAQLLGTGLWDQDEVAHEPALNGGIFAAPDKDNKTRFENAFETRFNAEPSRLASLAYDGINIAANIAAGDPRLKQTRLTDPNGFYGVDGFIRFGANGLAERGLAIYEIKDGRFRLIDPAPRTADEMALMQN